MTPNVKALNVWKPEHRGSRDFGIVTSSSVSVPSHSIEDREFTCLILMIPTGSGSQHDLMATDQCITVTDTDEILGHKSKYDVHKFNAEQPKGILHRAFSVFLFNKDNKLLLQQRAAGKITFPNVWTNTCCSHQLFGQKDKEVDETEAVLKGSAQVQQTASFARKKHILKKLWGLSIRISVLKNG